MKDILEEAQKPDWMKDDSPYSVALASAMTMAMVMLDKGASGEEYNEGMQIAREKVNQEVFKIVQGALVDAKLIVDSNKGGKDA